MGLRAHLPLALVLVVAGIARFWAIDFCLPSPLCRPDEEAVVAVSLGFFSRDYNPHFYDWPSLFMYAVTLALVPYFKYAKFAGWARSEYRFLTTIGTDPSPLLLIARLLSATAGVASVFFLYRTALRLFDRATAIAAALFLALAFLHVRDSHFGVTDVSATCLALAAFLFIARLAQTAAMRDLALAGLFSGMAAATKYNAAAIALPALWIVITDRSAGRTRVSVVSRCGAFVAIMVVAFALSTPYALIEFQATLSALRGVAAHLAGGHGPDVGLGWWVHLSSSLRYGLGLPLLATGLAGALLLVWQSPRIGIMVALFPLAIYVAAGSGRTVFARYVLPMVPFLCLTAAYAVAATAGHVAARRQWKRAPLPLTVGLALAIAAPSAWSVVQFNRLLAVDDSRLVAQRWIETRFPDGATIGETGHRFNRLHFVPPGFDHSSKYVTVVLTPTTPDPDIIIVPESPLHPRETLPEFTPDRLQRYELATTTSAPQAEGAVYDWQDEFYLPLTGFDRLTRPGPRITIYVRR